MQMDFVHYRPPVQRDSGGKSDRCATKMTTFKDEAKHIDVRDKSAHEAMGHVNGACPHEGGEAETSARPRLSPEQVWLLEQQFLAEPKPSTSTKRHLADLTNLSLTRVSNWFQNRRAKAKQQRRLEEVQLCRTPEDSGDSNSAKRPLAATRRPASWLSDLTTASFSTTSPAWHVGVAALSGFPHGSGFVARTDAGAAEAYGPLSPSLFAMEEAATAELNSPGAYAAGNSPLSTASGASSMLAGSVFSKAVDMSGNPDKWAGNAEVSTMWPAACPTPEDSLAVQIPPAAHHPVSSYLGPQLVGQHNGEVLAGLSSLAVEQTTLDSPLSQGGDVTGRLEHAESDDLHKPTLVAMGPIERVPGDSVACDIDPVTVSGPPEQQPSWRTLAPSGSTPDLAARRRRPRPAALDQMALHGPSGACPPLTAPSLKGFKLDPALPARRRLSMSARVQKPRSKSKQQPSPLNVATFAEAAKLEDELSGASAGSGMTAVSMAASCSMLPPVTPTTSSSENERCRSRQADTADRSPALFLSRPRSSSNSFIPPLQIHSTLASPPITPDETNLSGVQPYFDMFAPSPIGSEEPLSTSQMSGAADEPVFSPQFATFTPSLHMPVPMYSMPASSCGGSSGDDVDLTDFLCGIDAVYANQAKVEIHQQQHHHHHHRSPLAGFVQHPFEPSASFLVDDPTTHDEGILCAETSPPRTYIFSNSTPADF